MTAAWGRSLLRVFTKYYSGAYVDEEDVSELEALVAQGYVEESVRDGRLWAEAGPIGRCFRRPS